MVVECSWRLQEAKFDTLSGRTSPERYFDMHKVKDPTKCRLVLAELEQHNVPALASHVEVEAAGIQKRATSKYPASNAKQSASEAVPAKVCTQPCLLAVNSTV